MNKMRDLLSKTLVVGVIVLLISISVSPVVGNSSDYHSGISLITIKVDGETGLNDWYVSDVFFNFTYESDEIADILYWIDGGANQTYIEPFYLTEDGKDICLEWCAVDNNGNYSDADGPFIFSIDQTEPDISLTYEVVGGNPEHGWDFEFTATCSDDTSGMERVEFFKNDELQLTVFGPGPEYLWAFRHFPEPYVTFSAKAYDNAGNSDTDDIHSPPVDTGFLKSRVFYTGIDEENNYNIGSEDVLESEVVDSKSDIATEKLLSDNIRKEDFDPGYVIVVFNRKEIGANDWILGNVTISFYFESDRIDEVYYQINDEGWIQYSEPLVFSDGIYIFSWYVVDSEGYTSNPESMFFKIDTKLPEINLMRERLDIGKLKFIANVYDKTSGVDRVIFESIHGGNFTDYDFPFEWIWSPNDWVGWLLDLVSATVYDKAGNSNSCWMSTRSYSYNQQSSQQSTNLLIMRLFKIYPNMEVFLRIMNLLR